MRTINLGKTDLKIPVVAVGCMRINKLSITEAEHFLKTAMENGANFFDHADIYGGGECEKIFGRALDITSSKREKMIIQSKCGIVPGVMFDFSKEHIINSAEESIKRMGCEYLDVLLLHRPDTLFEPEEVGEAFEYLKSRGLVSYFGVSNQNVGQIKLLQTGVNVPICANQLQLSITDCTMIKSGINVNMSNDGAVDRDGGILEFCRREGITIQPWSPFQHGFFKGTFIDNPKFETLNKTLEKIGECYGVTKTTMCIAWLLRHPAHFQPIIGTMNENRLKECIAASEITISRQEWYEIYMSAGNILP